MDFANFILLGLSFALIVFLLLGALIYKAHECGIQLFSPFIRLRHRSLIEQLLVLLVTFGFIQYAVTKNTGNGGLTSGLTVVGTTVRPETNEYVIVRSNSPLTVTNLCFTGISISTNGVTLELAWPTNYFTQGTTLDFFAKYYSVTSAWQWVFASETQPQTTNLSVTINRTAVGPTNQTAVLFKVQDRSTCALSMDDSDGDSLSDAIELRDGTNPQNARNFCFNISFVEEGIFSTTNPLTAEVRFGTNVLAGPVVMTNQTWKVNLGHLVASNGESVCAYFWDDANSNGVREATEVWTSEALAIIGHDNALTNTLAIGRFDSDSDQILDYWEVLHADAGLSDG